MSSNDLRRLAPKSYLKQEISPPGFSLKLRLHCSEACKFLHVAVVANVAVAILAKLPSTGGPPSDRMNPVSCHPQEPLCKWALLKLERGRWS
jgi:hypothetical protein